VSPGRRVVITGSGAVSPYGRGVAAMIEGLEAGRSAVERISRLAEISGLRSHVAGRVPEVDVKEIPRRNRRSMSAMSQYATLACFEALEQAALPREACRSERVGVCIGSTTGSTPEIETCMRMYLDNSDLSLLRSTQFFKVMSHTCAANVAQTLGVLGQQLAPAAACATSAQAIGLGAALIAAGQQDVVLCGGADDYHPLTTAVFDVMNAASTAFNDRPSQTPRPFDADRDGVVCSEGAGIVVLEAREHAVERGAPILVELLGYGTCTDPGSVAHPDAGIIARSMRLALAAAELDPAEIDLVNAHATGTIEGDIAEGEGILQVFGRSVPVNSLKGHLGHTMAASAALELIAIMDMMARDLLMSTLNLEQPDPACGGIDLPIQSSRRVLRTCVKNSFALGGVNSTLVVRRETT
jgi:3-oxoacyl-[acyl-carrier-protein] synthase II